jgi:protein TonB
MTTISQSRPPQAVGHAALEAGASPLRDLGIWSLAAAVVLGLHGGALAWYLRERPVPISDDGPPPAIMIELASMPEATETDSTELSPDQQDSQQSAAVEEVKVAEPEPVVEEAPPEELPEQEDIAEPEDLLPEEVRQETEVALKRSPRPQQRPERQPPVRKTPREQPKPRPQEALAPSEARTKARNAEAKASSRDAAAQPTVGAGRAISPARWQNRMITHIKRHKPRARGERGTAYVRFTIDASGKVLSASLARGSGYSGIDEAAVNTVRSASPVPAPPPGVSLSMTVAIEFKR